MIKVRLVHPNPYKVRLKPEKGIKVNGKTVYLYDPDQAEEYIGLAKDWAIKMDGKVQEDGEEIDYSSKYYANQSKQSSDSAEASAESASSSATTATTKAQEATASADEAERQAGLAETSANSAETSATTATTQAGIATNQATIAGEKAIIATTQAGIATTKAGEAATSATNAHTSEVNAESSATSASESASTASQKATDAAGSATEAQGYATNAAQSATESASSATEASQSATSASNSATTATTQAGIATTQAGISTSQATISTQKATEASNSATSASNSATQSSQSADSSGASATRSQTWAEGTDAQVQSLGGEHSSKGWANVSKQWAETIDPSNFATAEQGSKADYAYAEISTYGNIVTHNVGEFATAAQGAKADTAIQNLGDLGITATATELNHTGGVTSNIQTQLNNKQATISDLTTIRTGAGLGATSLQPSDVVNNLTSTETAKPLSANMGRELNADVSSNTTAISTINGKIPSEATSSNKLADKNFVNSSINSVTAFYITRTAQGDQFNTKAQLDATTTFYSGGEVRVPTRNDYCIVLADETKTDPVTGENPTTRYIYQSGWEFQYVVNKTSLTAQQLAAVNSGITSGLVSDYSTHVANGNIHVTTADKSNWNGKQDSISDLSTIRSGASKGATSVQPNDNITTLTNNAGYITGITGAMVTTALGYTPYSSTNPNGYQTAAQVSTAISNNALAKTTKYGKSVSYSGNTLTLKDQDGTTLSTATITTATSLSALTDTQITTPTSGQVLKYDGSKWVNGTGGGGAEEDNLSITKNASDKIQTVGVIDQNNTSTALKQWSGTKAQYDAIASKDANTLYNITDDSDLSLPILQALYPVGSLYITTNETCPLANLFGTWQKVAQDRVLQGAGTRGSVGTTLNESLPNIRGDIEARPHSTGGNYGGALISASGCMTYSMRISSNQAGCAETTTASAADKVFFDANNSSSTYQDNAPVQQDAYLINIFKRTA